MGTAEKNRFWRTASCGYGEFREEGSVSPVVCPHCQAKRKGEPPEPIPSPLLRQVGGDHYKNLLIQPAEYAERNKLTACEFSIVKYVTRHRFKGGKQDLEKAMHFLELLMEFHYPEA